MKALQWRAELFVPKSVSARPSHGKGSGSFPTANIDPGSITRIFQQVDIDYDASLWWIGPDGRPLLREPALPSFTPRALAAASASLVRREIASRSC